MTTLNKKRKKKRKEKGLGQPGHSRCLEMGDNFMSFAKGRHKDVSMLSTGLISKQNLCGKPSIPLPCHTEEKRNFIALIKFRA